MDLRLKYVSLITAFYTDPNLIEKLWKDVEIHYGQPHRHYHTIGHIQSLFSVLEEQKDSLEDWPMVQFAIFYHDFIYDVTRIDNEEKSAADAVKGMMELGIEIPRIKRCKEHILATQGHSMSKNHDTNLFTDADLLILGASEKTYDRYAVQIRNEYSIYPDVQYAVGRTKVLSSLLALPNIYKTENFAPYEPQARSNLKRELARYHTLR